MKLWSMHHSIVLHGGSLTGRWLGDRRYLVAVRKPGRSIAWRSARSRLSQHLLQSICQGCTSPPFGPVLHFETMARTRGRYQQKLKVATSNDIFQKRQNASALQPVLSITCVSQKPNKNGNHKKNTIVGELRVFTPLQICWILKNVQICTLRGQCSWQPPDWKRRSFNHSLTKKTVSHWTAIQRIAHTHVAIQSIPFLFLCFLFLVQFFSSSKQIVGK